jgi:ribulose-5-phosphate 4-epimerase/fuculose-1-phosphate aldolase
VIDDGYVGLAFEKEGERCASLLSDPKIKIMIMGNHGLLVIGSNVADTFNRLYYFERAASQPLRVLKDEIAEKTAQELEKFPDSSQIFFAELKAILDEEEPSYRL